jgi:hypothetical protein
MLFEVRLFEFVVSISLCTIFAAVLFTSPSVVFVFPSTPVPVLEWSGCFSVAIISGIKFGIPVYNRIRMKYKA